MPSDIGSLPSLAISHSSQTLPGAGASGLTACTIISPEWDALTIQPGLLSELLTTNT